LAKEKVLSVRLKDEQHEKLKEITKARNISNSKFVRKLVNTHVKANDKGKRVYHVKVAPSQFKTIEEMAEKTNMKPEKYLRKLIKANLELDPEGKKPGERDISQQEYNDLLKKNEELTLRYEVVSKKYDQALLEKTQLEKKVEDAKSTIETLKDLNNEFLDHLLFLMNFFQKNAKLLQEHDRKFMVKNKEQFAVIAKQLEGKS